VRVSKAPGSVLYTAPPVPAQALATAPLVAEVGSIRRRPLHMFPRAENLALRSRQRANELTTQQNPDQGRGSNHRPSLFRRIRTVAGCGWVWP